MHIASEHLENEINVRLVQISYRKLVLAPRTISAYRRVSLMADHPGETLLLPLQTAEI